MLSRCIDIFKKYICEIILTMVTCTYFEYKYCILGNFINVLYKKAGFYNICCQISIEKHCKLFD